MNSAIGDGLTPLHYAALSGSAAAVGLLLDARADVAAADEASDGALDRGGEGDDGVVSQLLRARAEPRSADANGLAPLHHAGEGRARSRARTF